MATTDRADRAPSGESPSPVNQLLDELTGYLSAQAGQLADKGGEKLGDLTGQLEDVAKNGGTLADIGGRMLKGDSPLKAAVGGSLGGLKDKVKEVGGGLLGGGKGKGRKSGSKPTHITETVDVGLPLRTVYDHWTQYEKFSSFAKGVRSVSQGADTTSDWKVKVGPSTRSWKATVQEQVPDERIVWTSEGAKGTTRGCVSFHELAPSLTRIVLVVEYYPAGLFEKTGNIWRAQGRRLRLDLKHFVRYVTLTDEEPEGWRGEIQDGEVVRSHEEAVEEEESAEGEGGEEPEDEEEYPEEGEEEGGEYTDEEGAPEDEEYEEEDEDEGAPEDEAGPEDGRGEDAYDDEDEDADADADADEDEEDEEEEEPPRRRTRRARR